MTYHPSYHQTLTLWILTGPQVYIQHMLRDLLLIKVSLDSFGGYLWGQTQEAEGQLGWETGFGACEHHSAIATLLARDHSGQPRRFGMMQAAENAIRFCKPIITERNSFCSCHCVFN